MKYEELDKFMEDFINPDGTLDKEGITYVLKDTLEVNRDKLTANVPTHYFANEMIYAAFRNRAEILLTNYASKNQMVKWFKEHNLYRDVLELVEESRKNVA